LPVSTVNAPPAGWPEAVWTGNSVLQFTSGGAEGVRLYDAVNDSWSVGSTSGTPSKRYRYTVVWIGSQGIVWGGESPTGFGTLQERNDGAIYCPCSPIAFYQDSDGDGSGNSAVSTQACSAPFGYVANSQDCDDTDAAVWGTPSEVTDLVFADAVSLQWSAPASPGATSVFYDLLISENAADFSTQAACLVIDSAVASATAAAIPAEGAIFHYLARAVNRCPEGEGPLGNDSSGQPRSGRTCP